MATGNFRHRHTVGRRYLIPEDDGPSRQAFMHVLMNSQPVQVIMHQPWQTTLVVLSPCHQTCCSVQSKMQLVSDSVLCRSKNRKLSHSVNATKAWTSVLTDSMFNDRRTQLTKLEETRLLKHVLQTFDQWCGASRHCLASRQPWGAIFTASASVSVSTPPASVLASVST